MAVFRGPWRPTAIQIDAYVLGVAHPLERCAAKNIAVIRRRDDVEDKIVAAMSGEWDKASIERATEFQEQYFDSWVALSEESG